MIRSVGCARHRRDQTLADRFGRRNGLSPRDVVASRVSLRTTSLSRLASPTLKRRQDPLAQHRDPAALLNGRTARRERARPNRPRNSRHEGARSRPRADDRRPQRSCSRGISRGTQARISRTGPSARDLVGRVTYGERRLRRLPARAVAATLWRCRARLCESSTPVSRLGSHGRGGELGRGMANAARRPRSTRPTLRSCWVRFCGACVGRLGQHRSRRGRDGTASGKSVRALLPASARRWSLRCLH